MGIIQQIKEFYGGRKKRQEQKEKVQNFQLRKKAVKHGRGRTGMGVENEYELNVALVNANRPFLIKGSAGKQIKELYDSFHYVEQHLAGEKKTKYEEAVLKRAERLKGRLLQRYDKEFGIYLEAMHDYRASGSYGVNPMRYKKGIDSWREGADEIQRDIIKKLKAPSNLETTAGGIAVIGLILGISFLSPNLTGLVIFNSKDTVNPANIIGGILILIGIFSAILHLSLRKN